MHIFLSYTSQDHAQAQKLKNAIEAKEPEARVFFAPQALRLGMFWQPQLAEAIGEAQAVVLLLGTRIGNSQLLEYYESLDRRVKEKTFPLVAIVTADRAPGLPFLRQLHWIETRAPEADPALSRIVGALKGDAIAPTLEAWRTVNPYPGLPALTEANADFLFGRDAKTVEIIDAIAGSAEPRQLITLIGNSGVGKSSLMQAGVIPALKRQRLPREAVATWDPRLTDSRAWAYLVLRPGERPIRALAAAFVNQWFEDPTDPARLARIDAWEERLQGKGCLAELVDAGITCFHDAGINAPKRILLYIDQGEELYASGTPRESIRRFSELLADGLADARLIALTSLRADYYGRLQENETLFPISRRIDVLPLTSQELETVLREPARALGASFENEGLVGTLLDGAEGQAGALPLLADHMTELWQEMQRRGDGKLRVEDPAQLIQVGSVLTRRADAFLGQHPEEVEKVTRLFTLKLVHVPREGEPVRRRIPQSRCADTEWRLIEMLSGEDWRLLVIGGMTREGAAEEPTAEIAHDVLLREWDTLKGWIEKEREFLAWKGEVEAARRQHETLPERDRAGALLMGRSLVSAQSWLATRGDDIEPEERSFILASAAKERASQRARKRAVAAAFIALSFLAILALWQWQEAIGAKRALSQSIEQLTTTLYETNEARKAAISNANKANEAEQVALGNLAGALAALSKIEVETNPSLAMKLALAAWPRDANDQMPKREVALDSLSAAVIRSREHRVLKGHVSPVHLIAWSPDGTRLATASADNTGRLWDAASGKEIAVLQG